jgi:hypothetical protein
LSGVGTGLVGGEHRSMPAGERVSERSGTGESAPDHRFLQYSRFLQLQAAGCRNQQAPAVVEARQPQLRACAAGWGWGRGDTRALVPSATRTLLFVLVRKKYPLGRMVRRVYGGARPAGD